MTDVEDGPPGLVSNLFSLGLRLQVMTSLSAALASFLAGLRKGAVLFPSLKRVDARTLHDTVT